MLEKIQQIITIVEESKGIPSTRHLRAAFDPRGAATLEQEQQRAISKA